ncbi:hypothetical protein HK097_003864 [Rhizophlyctis rosea]|uniref:Uncharacterized protein n=1 Tax=Rhizophlyctis rosea TaxID=64517 RepID=A0AAD5S287_9FUNG|nr:hypothetical protein HK097_003864 [Rhizophlyctis rosea]
MMGGKMMGGGPSGGVMPPPGQQHRQFQQPPPQQQAGGPRHMMPGQQGQVPMGGNQQGNPAMGALFQALDGRWD